MCSDRTRNSPLVSGICSLFLIFTVSMTTSAPAQTVAALVPPKQSAATMERSLPVGIVKDSQRDQNSLAASPLFAETATYASGGREVAAVVAADVNGDGVPDLLVANAYYYNTIGVLLANGYGAYLPVVTYSSGGGFPVSIVPVDVNGDGKLDLVVFNQTPCYACSGDGLVAVLLGNGDGTFQPAMTYDSGGVNPPAGDEGPNPMAVVDVNGDGKVDVVVANCAPKGSTGCGDGNGNIGVLLGNGDGTFQPVVTHTTGFSQGGTGLAVGDLNGDGELDVIVTGSCKICQKGHIAVLLGNGNGTFKPPVHYALLEAGTSGIAIADLNSDGKLDVVVGGCCLTSDGLVTVMLGNGDGTLGAPRGYGEPFPDGLALADVNGDGILDILVADDAQPTALGVLEGVGDGTFLAPLNFYVHPSSVYLNPSVFSVAVTDVNRDGKPDVIVGGSYGTNDDFVTVFINSPTATYQSTKITLSSSLNPSAFGQSVTFTARVTVGEGSVPDGEPIIFSQGTKRLASVPSTGGTASYTTSSLSVGGHYITAAFSGDTYLKSSKATGIKQVVE